ncbi:phage antirepressor KilAC domain-containing protein [Lysinibacillus xylanilyticus]|uniref:Rha family transcriptional regulator n=1 Tax=Lysinibacillus xylanilyticus TaxID=582475 RepID=A0A2M9Q7C0_9BACI|nr:phage antirepressor KilAC domain-containing protein [Lysinibacillus xylanilyticus]PJO43892.1 Rha family transcriptional regulator [Lysinibacillus xylanilyticus]
MNQLKVITFKGQLVTDSREIAEMVGKRHSDLLESINGYKQTLENGKFRSQDFFINHTYKSTQNKELPCFLLTRKGCDMVANKMTGEKGVLFTAAYVIRFEEMEKQLSKPQLNLPSTYKEALIALLEKEGEREQLELANKQKDQIIGEMKPKADYTDRILNSKGLMTITQIAKDYGMSGQAMNNKLHELGVQYNQGGQWLLYSKYHDKGFTHSQTIDITRSNGSPDTKLNTKWTQKGRLFLYNLLKSKGIVPVIERNDKPQLRIV